MDTRRRLVIVVLIVLSASALAISQCGLERQARAPTTPTRTPRPTFTPTALPTDTPVPTATPLPSETPTPTPLPTDTPPPEPTQAPSPTAVEAPTSPPPTPTLRPTPRPTRRPTPKPTARPTNTPAPPFRGSVVKGYARCDGFSAVMGTVRHANGSGYGGVAIGVWSDTWDGEVAVSQESGKFDVLLNGKGIGKFYAGVVRLETCTQQGGATVARGCELRSNRLEVTVTEKCSGTGANQVTEVRFDGP